jgi:hypothetical protein
MFHAFTSRFRWVDATKKVNSQKGKVQTLKWAAGSFKNARSLFVFYFTIYELLSTGHNLAIWGRIGYGHISDF